MVAEQQHEDMDSGTNHDDDDVEGSRYRYRTIHRSLNHRDACVADSDLLKSTG